MYKIYLDAVTGELIVEDTINIIARPKYSEVFRRKHKANETITIGSMHNYGHHTEWIARERHFSNCQKENGTAYATFDELWDALTPYFSI